MRGGARGGAFGERGASGGRLAALGRGEGRGDRRGREACCGLLLRGAIRAAAAAR